MQAETAQDPLLGADEPAPFEVIRESGKRPLILTCDHASHRMPGRLDSLGVPRRYLRSHIAWDIGAATVTRELCRHLGATTAVLGGYSRLVIDLNRNIEDSSAFPPISDGVLIPGNLGLTESAKMQRERCLYEPYHEAVRGAIAGASDPQSSPVLIAIHSFTPRLNRFARPWHIGVLWDKDPRLAVPLMAALRATGELVVGDNEPYSGRHPADYTIDHHAEPLHLAHVGIEIRQDLIAEEPAAEHMAERLATLLAPLLVPELNVRRRRWTS
jgi:predicted N-formylglutamate amidohydrolase